MTSSPKRGVWRVLDRQRRGKPFGPAAARRTFTGNGGPRWKQRALYVAVRDAIALHTEGIGLIRVSIYDKIDGVPLGRLLKPGKLVAPQQLEKLTARRTIPTGTTNQTLPARPCPWCRSLVAAAPPGPTRKDSLLHSCMIDRPNTILFADPPPRHPDTKNPTSKKVENSRNPDSRIPRPQNCPGQALLLYDRMMSTYI